MSLRRRSGHWHYRFMVLGKTWTDDTGLVDTERNRKAAEAVESEAWRNVKLGKTANVRVTAKKFDEAAELFLADCRVKHAGKKNTYNRVSGSFASIATYFGTRLVASIDSLSVVAYATWRLKGEPGIKGVVPITVRHDLHSLSKFFKFAIKQGWCHDNPVLAEDIPSDKDAERINVQSPEQEQAFFDAIKLKWPKLRDLCRLILLQGCRPEELLAMQVSHVDLLRMTIRIVEGKSAAAKRTLKLRRESVEILTRLTQAAKGEYIFCSERSKTKKMSLSTIEGQMARVNVPGVNCVIYDWRHTFGTRAANSGTSLASLKNILGHSSLRSVMKYVHPSQDDLDSAMDALDNPSHPANMR
jgi:site-specific recombinase XerD